MVEAVASGSLPLSFAYATRFSGDDKITVPVRPSVALYAQFQHIAGVPAPKGSATVGIDRLQILEILINQLENASNLPRAAGETAGKAGAVHIDELIQQYGRELHSIAAAPPRIYIQTLALAPGALFSLAA